MRRDGIPYVQNPASYYPPVDINKLSLEEIRKKFIKTCGKANGNISVCSKCQTPCKEGKRAIQLLANEVYNDPPVPLFAGKTLIEMAKEENRLKREAAEAKKLEEQMTLHAENKPEENKKRLRLEIDDWWEESLQAKDQVEFLVSRYNISKTQAKRKLYHARKVKGIVEIEMPVLKSEPKEDPHVEPAAPVAVSSYVSSNQNDLVAKTFELKISDLMNKQAEYKAKMEEYTKKYKEISEQIDVLCKAMDVLDKI